jgi:Amt family ammonium transporter
LTIVPLTVVLWLAMGGLAWAIPDGQGTAAQGDEFALVFKTALAWLVPIGLGMLACGTVPPDRAAAVVRVGWLALGVSVIGYWLAGYAFQFGGLGFAYQHPDLAGLAREWTWAPLDATWGTQWGLIGLEGYLLRGPASTPMALQLFFVQLPWITTAVAVPLWSLQGRTGPVTLVLSSVLLAFTYSSIGNWTWGGGWLANLGMNLDLGHGYVDLAGVGAIHLAGAASALAGMLAFGVRSYARSRLTQLPLPTMTEPNLPGASSSQTSMRWTARDEPYVPMPALHLPILATFGAWLAVVGWLGWTLCSPMYVVAQLQVPWIEMLIGLMLAAAGGASVALVFSWLTTGDANALMTARGALGALIAVGAGLPFFPLWTTLAIGAVAGLLVPFVQYAIDHLLRLDDPTSAIAMHGVPALWGLLAVGLFADGRGGGGWNRVGLVTYLGVDGQGVTGYLALPGYVSDWPGQFTAQAIGAAAIGVTVFVLSWVLFALVRGITRAWQGEYTVRLPARTIRLPARTIRLPARTAGRRRARARAPGYAAAGPRWPRIRFVRAEQEMLESQPETESPEPDQEQEALGEAILPTRQPKLAALDPLWRWVREKAVAVALRVRKPKQPEQVQVSSESTTDLAEANDLLGQAQDALSEADGVAIETGDAWPEARDTSCEAGDAFSESGDDSGEQESTSTGGGGG